MAVDRRLAVRSLRNPLVHVRVGHRVVHLGSTLAGRAAKDSRLVAHYRNAACRVNDL